MNKPPDREERFRTVYATAYDDVLRYAQRRCQGTSTSAEDIVAEAMTILWRRIDDLPTELDDARAWVFGIARNCVLNYRRSSQRRDALGVRLADATARAGGVTADCADSVVNRVDLARAWGELTDDQQDVLALTVFEGLSSRQAGQVLGISDTAYRLRLSRARAGLRRRLQGAANHADATFQEVTP